MASRSCSTSTVVRWIGESGPTVLSSARFNHIGNGSEGMADHIAQGSIPVDEALPRAKQIAEALEAAHEAGVIHRDRRPANISTDG